jgi:hypothetical protein
MKKTLNFLLISIFSINNSMEKEEISENKSKNKSKKKLSDLQLKNKIIENFKKNYDKEDEIDEAFKYLNNRDLLNMIDKKFSEESILNDDACEDILNPDIDSYSHDTCKDSDDDNESYDPAEEVLYFTYKHIVKTINNLNKSPLIKLNNLNILEDSKEYEKTLKNIFKRFIQPSVVYFYEDLDILVKNFNESIFKDYKEKYIKLLNRMFSQNDCDPKSMTDYDSISYFSELIADLNKSPLSGDLNKYETILKFIISNNEDDKDGIRYGEIELLHKKIKNPDNYYNILKKIYIKKNKTNMGLKRVELLKSLKDANEDENLSLLNNFLNK